MVRIELPAEYTYLQSRLMRRQAWVDDALLSLAEAACDAPLPHPPGALPIMVTQMSLEDDAPCVEENEFLFRCVEFLAEAMSLAVAVSRWHHTNEVSPNMYGAAVRFPDGPPLGSGSGAGSSIETPRGKTGVIGASEVYPEAADEGEFFLDERLPYVLNPRALHASVSDIKVISPFTLEEYSVIELIEECEEVHMGNCAASEQERLSAMPNPYAVAREHGHDLAACLAEYESWVCRAEPM